MKIKFLEGPYKEKEYEFTSSCVTIGRDGGNQLILDTDGVSRCHAELRQKFDGTWSICDLNSTNGIKVNGSRIDSNCPVTDGDQLVIGENTLQISQLSSEPARVIFKPIISSEPLKVPEDPLPPQPQIPQAGSIPVRPAHPAPSPAQTPQMDVPPAQTFQAPPASEKAPEKPAAAGVDLKKFSGSLFGQKGNKRNAAASAASEENSQLSEGGDAAKKKRSNLIFYTVLVCVIIMVLSSAFSFMNPSRTKKRTQAREEPLILRFKKEIISKDNVFRFDFQLKSAIVKKTEKSKDGKSVTNYSREYSVIFTIDDIASSRHFSREVTLSNETVEELRRQVRSSGIYAIQADKSFRGNSYKRQLLIVDGDRLLETVIEGERASTEFNAVEEAIITVTENFGLKTIAMTPTELIEMANKSFLNAEDLYGNRRAGATNLRDAIKNYRITVESLEQFSPKPPRWEQARIKLAAAIKERDLMLDALETEYRRLAQQRDFESMKTTFKQIMDLTDPESREHGSARRRLIYIEQVLRKK